METSPFIIRYPTSNHTQIMVNNSIRYMKMISQNLSRLTLFTDRVICIALINKGTAKLKPYIQQIITRIFTGYHNLSCYTTISANVPCHIGLSVGFYCTRFARGFFLTKSWVNNYVLISLLQTIYIMNRHRCNANL